MPGSHPASSIACTDSDTSGTTSAAALRTTSAVAAWVRPRDGNAADVHYLEEARAALGPIMAASRAVAASGRSHHVRALARLAHAEQADELAAITAVLSRWRQLDVHSGSTPLPDAVRALRTTDQDQHFVDHLTAHAHASVAAARAEMIAGASPAARSLAEQAIHAHDRRLSAISLLFPPTTSRP
jgi:uncharacterized protein (DUF305 family)